MTVDLDTLRPGDRATAWDIIGFDGAFRVDGGRVVWEAADYDDRRGGSTVRLTRLRVNASGLHVATRYVHPDTPVTIAKTRTSLCICGAPAVCSIGFARFCRECASEASATAPIFHKPGTPTLYDVALAIATRKAEANGFAETTRWLRGDA
jgi:hypothetical protein